MLEFNLLKRYPLANVKNIWCLRGQIQSKPIYGLVTYEMASPYDKSTKAVSIEFAPSTYSHLQIAKPKQLLGSILLKMFNLEFYLHTLSFEYLSVP